MNKKILWGHSPDADDAFMLYGIATGKVIREGFIIEQVVKDIESLNLLAMDGKLELTAVSMGAMPYICMDYGILPYGTSMGDGYGPVVITDTGKNLSLDKLNGKKIALPGKYTAAALTFSILVDDFQPVYTNFDNIMNAVRTGEVDAGVIIHEGQVTYSDNGFESIGDLGALWKKETGLPLPLGLDVIKMKLGSDIDILSDMFKETLQYSKDHMADALAYAESFGRGIRDHNLSKFVNMYVNDYTMELGETGKNAIKKVFHMAYEKKLINTEPELQFV